MDHQTALAVDLLLRPPVSECGPHEVGSCLACARRGRVHVVGIDGRHWSKGSCFHGVRSDRAIHNPVRDVLARLLSTIVSPDRLYIERSGRGGGQSVAALAALHGLRHRPDLAVADWDGPGSYLVIEIKSFDSLGRTRLATHHTDRSDRRGAAHRAVEQRALAQYIPLPPRFRVVTVAIDPYGVIGPEGLALISEMGRRAGGAVPLSLYDETSWAAPQFAPFVRMAVGFAARRGLAEQLRRWWGSHAEGERRAALHAAGVQSGAEAAAGDDVSDLGSEVSERESDVGDLGDVGGDGDDVDCDAGGGGGGAVGDDAFEGFGGGVGGASGVGEGNGGAVAGDGGVGDNVYVPEMGVGELGELGGV